MKTVYVDILISVNIFIDFLLLLCTKQFMHLRAKLIRIILASIIGGALSLSALLPHIPFFLNLLMDLLSAALLVFTAFGKTNFISFLKRTAVFFSVSFSFCGIMVFVYTMFRPKGMEIYNDVVYFNISPIVLIILTLLCYYTMLFINKMTKGKIRKQICSVSVTAFGKSICFNAIIDTGCDIREPFSGEYVIIAEKEIFQGICLKDAAMRIIPFNSMGGKGILTGFQPDSIELDGKQISRRLYIGLCENVMKGDIKAIVPFEITNKI